MIKDNYSKEKTRNIYRVEQAEALTKSRINYLYKFISKDFSLRLAYVDFLGPLLSKEFIMNQGKRTTRAQLTDKIGEADDLDFEKFECYHIKTRKFWLGKQTRLVGEILGTYIGNSAEPVAVNLGVKKLRNEKQEKSNYETLKELANKLEKEISAEISIL